MITKKIVVLGLGQRGSIYANYSKMFPDKFELVAIIENDLAKIERAKNKYPNSKLFTDLNVFLKQKIQADIVAVATQDADHKDHAVVLMEAGYDILLEKPIANNMEDCLAIYKASKKYNRKVIVCHVLRYTPFYSTIKNIIKSGRLGDIVTINASENVGYYHQAHSFVRGPWRNKETSSPMILAKCCHDMDMIRYLMNEKCLSVASYGGLYFFKEQNAPEGCGDYCSDCKYVDCIYKAQTLYTANDKDWCANYFTNREHTYDNIVTDLKHTQYDKCVFKCDNDVVDHQVCIMQFENGKTATLTMTAFSKDIYRDIKIHGTKAELVGKCENDVIEIRNFGSAVEVINVNSSHANVGGHMGGDFYLMENVFKAMNGEQSDMVSYLDVSMESHLMSFFAEQSRLENGTSKKIEV